MGAKRAGFSKGIVILLVLGLFLASFFGVRNAHAQANTIYVDADGSIEGTTHIQTADNVTYFFTANINDPIVVQRDNITINGNGFTLQGTGSGYGIDLSGRTNVTVQNATITGFDNGVYLDYSSNNTVNGIKLASNSIFGISLNTSSTNVIVDNDVISNGGYYVSSGILLNSSSNNIVSGNIITNNEESGIILQSSSNNTIAGDYIAGNYFDGIDLYQSSNNNSITNNTAENNPDIGILLSKSNFITLTGNNIINNVMEGLYSTLSMNDTIYHNNFINNTVQTYALTSFIGNNWDNGYPSGGNYWSDYNGTDLNSGTYQNLTGSDGIGDTPYIIDPVNRDNYPLMGPVSDFNIAQITDVEVVSNSTVSNFQFNDTALMFDVNGENGTTGFCRISFPTSLLNGTLTVFVNGTQIPYTLLPVSNSTQDILYFTYSHSTKQVTIIPEFPTFILLPLFIIATLIAIVFCRKPCLTKGSSQAERRIREKEGRK